MPPPPKVAPASITRPPPFSVATLTQEILPSRSNAPFRVAFCGLTSPVSVPPVLSVTSSLDPGSTGFIGSGWLQLAGSSRGPPSQLNVDIHPSAMTRLGCCSHALFYLSAIRQQRQV